MEKNWGDTPSATLNEHAWLVVLHISCISCYFLKIYKYQLLYFIFAICTWKNPCQ